LGNDKEGFVIDRVSSVTVQVSDQDQALDFYTSKLGFTKQSDERFGAQDIQAVYEAYRSRGVTFTELPTKQSWGGLQAQFTDQDGNGFVLVQY
jgi:uncharacterized glyoxalase superfamily protein PhnB